MQPDTRLPKIELIGYWPEYRVAAINSETGLSLTDIIFFSIEPTSEGQILSNRFTAAVRAQMAVLRATSGVRISVAVGGWGRSDGFPAMTADAIKRRGFAQNLRDFCLANGFDGADFDWEFPSNAVETESYSQLLQDVRDAFAPDSLLISVALNVSQSLSPAGYAALDRLHVMAYDNGGRHSTYDAAVNAVSYFLQQGVPADKICLGVPFYGRRIDRFEDAKTYAEIIAQFSPAPDADEAGGYYFNSQETIARKARFAMQESLRGIMIWEIGQDTHDERSLLQTLNATVRE